MSETSERDDSSPGQRQPSTRLRDEHAATTARVESLRRQLDANLEYTARSSNDDEHDPEGATIGFERAQLQALLDEAREELAELARAAERLRGGSYGSCENCGAEIGGERLTALPAVRTCIDCASATGGRRRR